MFPLSDDNRGRHTQPYVTYTLIAINVVVFLYEQLLPEHDRWRFFADWGTIPQSVLHDGGTAWVGLVTGLFLHASWLHLGGNMLFLWIFGDNVEDVMGHITYLIFYLVVGVIGSLAHCWINPDSQTVLIGASGAISGVLAAYVVCFPHGRISTLVFLKLFVTVVMLPAWVMIGIWGVLQLAQGILSIGVAPGQADSIAYLAHIGGFVAGLALVWPFTNRQRLADQRLARSTIPASHRLRMLERPAR